MNLQSKSRVRQSSGHTPSPPLSPKVPPVVDGESAAGGDGGGGGGGGGAEDAAEVGLNEQQQLAMQQEERILNEQIESLQKEKYDLSLMTLEVFCLICVKVCTQAYLLIIVSVLFHKCQDLLLLIIVSFQ